jgi:hypothetical protein
MYFSEPTTVARPHQLAGMFRNFHRDQQAAIGVTIDPDLAR